MDGDNLSLSFAFNVRAGGFEYGVAGLEERGADKPDADAATGAERPPDKTEVEPRSSSSLLSSFACEIYSSATELQPSVLEASSVGTRWMCGRVDRLIGRPSRSFCTLGISSHSESESSSSEVISNEPRSLSLNCSTRRDTINVVGETASIGCKAWSEGSNSALNDASDERRVASLRQMGSETTRSVK